MAVCRARQTFVGDRGSKLIRCFYVQVSGHGTGIPVPNFFGFVDLQLQ